MKKKCSFCGMFSEEITGFKAGYVCDECLNYIRNTEILDLEHISRSDAEVEKTENRNTITPVSET